MSRHYRVMKSCYPIHIGATPLCFTL